MSGAQRPCRTCTRRSFSLFSWLLAVADVKGPLLPSHKRTDSTVFKPFLDLDTQPVLFIPDVHFTSLQRGTHVGTLLLGHGPAYRNSGRDSAYTPVPH